MDKKINTVITLVSSTYLAYCGAIFLLLLPPILFLTQGIVFTFFPPQIERQVLDKARDQAWMIVVVGREPLESQPQDNRLTGFGSGLTYSPQEISHLQDVHKLLIEIFAGGVIAAMILFWKREAWLHISRKALAFFIAVLCFCTLFATLIFPLFFEEFHQIFFTQGNYSFSSNSLIIHSFPIEFWMLNFISFQLIVITFFIYQLHRAVGRKL